MILNADKYHFLFLVKDRENQTLIFSNLIFNDSNEEKILGITTENKLTFGSNIIILCKKLPRNRDFIKAIKSSK